MNLYRQLTTTYHQLTARPPRWTQQLADLGTLDTIVNTIADDHPDPARSDTALRRLVNLAATHPDALTVALHALAPRLRHRLGRSATADYRDDALATLALVLLDSDLAAPTLTRLADRAVNRAHSRTYKSARRTRHRGVTRDYSVAPLDPDRLAALCDDHQPDIADAVCDALDLSHFIDAVHAAIDDGRVAPAVWANYRDHRLRHALDPAAVLRTSTERKAATRAARHLQPIVDRCLHAA